MKSKGEVMRNTIFTRIQNILWTNYKNFRLIREGFAFSEKNKWISIIKQADASNNEKDRLLSLLKYGSIHFEFIKEYLECCVARDKASDPLASTESPVTVICVVKNDLLRMKVFLNHYRNLGVKRFLILDDKSTDGTREYLCKQKDVIVFNANKDYSTVRRQVWINKIIELEGYEKWYLVVDSDELLDYENSNNRSIDYLVHLLESRKRKVAKALLLDMFSEDSLFAENINTENMVSKYSYFLSNYHFVQGNYDVPIKGGAREELFSLIGEKNSPVVSKYPLIFVDKNTILINSHCCFPHTINRDIGACIVLKHYKFLPNDRDKYLERIKAKNFHNGSSEYELYFKIERENTYELIRKKMTRYESYDSVKSLDVIER